MNGFASVRGAQAVGVGFAASALGCLLLLAGDASPTTLALLAALHAAGAAAALAVLASLRRSLLRSRALLELQVEAAGHGLLEERAQEGAAEWAPLQRALNVMVVRLKQQIDDRDRRLGELQTEVSVDELTGVAARTLFIDRLTAKIASLGPGTTGGLVMLRVEDLGGYNQRAGRHRADELLKSIATLLRTRLPRLASSGGVVGRLNGSDFALAVPATTAERLQAFHGELVEALKGLHQHQLSDRPRVAWVAATLFHAGEGAHEVLTRADNGLLGAESGSAEAASVQAVRSGSTLSLGQWRSLLDHALATGRVGLVFSDVRTLGAQVHHRIAQACLQHDEFHALDAREIGAAAQRTGRAADMDLRAVELALAATAQDGRDIALKLALAAFERPAFVSRLDIALADAGERARHLRLEIDLPADEHALAIAEPLAAVLRRHGVRLGLAGITAPPENLLPLQRLGVCYLRLAPRLAARLAADGSVAKRRLLQLMVEIGRDEGLEVLAPAAASAADARVLQGLGIPCGLPPEPTAAAPAPATAPALAEHMN